MKIAFKLYFLLALINFLFLYTVYSYLAILQVWKLRNVDHWLSINKITKKTEVIFFGNKDKEFYLLYTDNYTKLLAPIGQVKNVHYYLSRSCIVNK